MIVYITLTCTTIMLLLFMSLLYLHIRHVKRINYLYASLPFLCGAITLFGQFQLELGLRPYHAIFWTKFKYVGIFGYFLTFPLFMTSITKKRIKSSSMIILGALTALCLFFTFFTQLIVTDRIHFFANIMRAETGVLYPFVMMSFLVICFYHYTRVFTEPKKILSKQFNYAPVIIGLAIAFATAVVDVVGITRNQPVIKGITNPLVFGAIVFSLTYLWTFLSQHAWFFNALNRSEEKISNLIEKSNADFMQFVQLIAKTLDAKDHYTAGHSLRVMNYAVRIAYALELPESEIEILTKACLLHDIGKIGIPDGILNKKKPLTEDEREHITNHPVLGKQMLGVVTEFANILDIIYSHHERVDGKGYPNGLTKDEIPLFARILAVADTYDAMLSERPYRRAKTELQAICELEKVKGSQLDEKIVDKFIQKLQA